MRAAEARGTLGTGLSIKTCDPRPDRIMFDCFKYNGSNTANWLLCLRSATGLMMYASRVRNGAFDVACRQ